MSSSSSSARGKVILPGESVSFHTNCAPGKCPPGPALRFITKCRPPAMPMATAISTDKAPAAQ